MGSLLGCRPHRAAAQCLTMARVGRLAWWQEPCAPAVRFAKASLSVAGSLARDVQEGGENCNVGVVLAACVLGRET